MIYTGEEALRWKKLRDVSIVVAIVSLGLAVFVHPFFFLLAVAFGICAKYATGKFKRWASGFEGEYQVIEALSRAKCIKGVLLSDVVLPNMRSNIDHVLICEQGIFAIETKAYTGIYHAEGDEWYHETLSGTRIRIKSLSRVAKRNAAMLSRFLNEKYGEKYFVQPILVFAGATVFDGVSTVPVLFPSRIEKYICSLPKTMSKQEIARLSDLLASYSGHVMEVGEL